MFIFEKIIMALILLSPPIFFLLQKLLYVISVASSGRPGYATAANATRKKYFRYDQGAEPAVIVQDHFSITSSGDQTKTKFPVKDPQPFYHIKKGHSV